MANKLPPILVTGAPRSGTTFIGRMMSLPRQVAYVDEPLNNQTGILGADRAFVYLDDSGNDVDNHYKPLLQGLVSGRAKFKRGDLPSTNNTVVNRLGRHLFNSRSGLDYFLSSLDPQIKRYLIKDPNACFASQYMHRNIGMDTLVIIRHPASTIASYKRLGWNYDLRELTSQKPLMDKYLMPMSDKLKMDGLTPVQKWSYFWLAIYTVLDDYLANNPDMVLIRHEDLSLAPLKHLENIYNKFDLPFTRSVQEAIVRHTRESNPIDAPGNAAHVLKRNSALGIHRWKEILTHAEIEEIKRITCPFADKFYAASEW